MNARKPSRHRAIADDLRTGIGSGTYPTGSRLPSLRSLARIHGAGLNTVAAALRLLQTEGLVTALPRSGFRVIQAPRLPTADPDAPRDIADVVLRAWRNREVPGMVVLSNCILPPELSPVSCLQAQARTAMEKGIGLACAYVGMPGYPPLRQAIARHLRSLGAHVDADDILITNGAMEAVHLALRSTCRPGALVAIESPCYAAHLLTLDDLDLRPLPIVVHPDLGLDCEALAECVRNEQVAAVLCSPVHANPHGGCLSDASRRQLLDLCHRHRIPIIEDDANGELSHQHPRLPPLLADDRHGTVLHAGSLTKTLGAGLQLGFLVTGAHMASASRHKVACNLSAGALPQVLANELLSCPELPRLQARIGATLAERMRHCRDTVLAHFPAGSQVSQPSGGTALWIRMPPEVDGARLYADGIRSGVRANPGTLYGADHRHALRIATGHWSTGIERAIAQLGRLACHQLRSG
ncbi:MAG: PLP-dependent aminotransferase family protein [Planctomycetota bacterium]